MAKDTLNIRFELQAPFATIQAIRQTLAEPSAQANLVSALSETVNTHLSKQIKTDFQLKASLKVSPVRRSRRGRPQAPLPKMAEGFLSTKSTLF